MTTSKITLTLFILLISLCTNTGCKKDKENIPNPTPTPTNKREVKYELTGTYDNHLTIAYTAIDGILESVTVPLPWTKEITYQASVAGIGIGGNSASGAVFGAAGQTVIIKIYSGGALVKSSTATADSDGKVNMPTLAYVFP